MTDSAKRTTRELAGNAGLALVLLVFFLGLFVVRGFRFPVGPDGPVYLWWTRLAAVDGLAAVERPGVPGVTLALAGTLHLPVVAIVAALQCGLGVSVGLSAATLLREMASRDRATSLLGGALTGLFAVHLVSGYLANLALAATFLAGACALALGTRRGAVAASILIGAGGLSHPQFFLVAIAILALTAGLARLRNQPEARSEARRVVGASLGAAALAGVGFLVLLVGPAAPQVDTSRDGFLRRVGLLGTLAHLYRQRFLQHSARYVEWISLPLAIAGFGRVRGFVGRFLASWGIVTAVGVAFGLATALLPPDRFLAFGYVVPLLAAVGAMRLWRALHPRRAVATALVVALVGLMALGTVFAWRRQRPFLTPVQVASVTAASRWIEGTRPGTPLVFPVETGTSTITFFATEAGNAIRASVPPDRIRDVLVIVPGGNAPSGSERDLLSRDSFDQYARAVHADGMPTIFDLRAFDGPVFGTFNIGPLASRVSCPEPRTEVRAAQDVEIASLCGPPPRPGPVPADPLEPSSPAQIALGTVLVLAALSVVGFGWARATRLDITAAATLSPAFGLAAFTLTAVALERAGVPLTGSLGPSIVSALAGAGGYVAWNVAERRTVEDPAPEVDER